MTSVFMFCDKFIKLVNGIQLTSKDVDNTLTDVAANLTTLKHFDVIQHYKIYSDVVTVVINIHIQGITVIFTFDKLDDNKMALINAVIK